MNAISQILAGTMPKISAVKPLDKLFVEVTWSEGSRAPRIERVDLGPLINSFKFYKPLRDNQALFDTVHLIDDGEVLAWGDADAIDMPATSVERLAEEMMTPDDFRVFVSSLNYTHNTAAAQLGYSRRHIENFLSGTKPIPRVCVLACMALQHRHVQREAHYAFASTALSTGSLRDFFKQQLPATSTQAVIPRDTYLLTFSRFSFAALKSRAATYDAP